MEEEKREEGSMDGGEEQLSWWWRCDTHSLKGIAKWRWTQRKDKVVRNSVVNPRIPSLFLVRGTASLIKRR
jgi:hypothetical protein